MSHATIQSSPAGTPLTERTVGEIVAERPAQSRVFQRFGIDCMMHEHDDAGAALARLRELTHGFTPPDEACNTYRALFGGLAELEEDLHRHIHLENSVLFPAARKLQEN